ncbi:MAG: pyridoxal-phosphate dependent enzyme [Polyangiaceae bacterium]|nr:pyridoxal-phosphate dependent enzyme [Polyangiaceae bacterium]
MSEAEVPASKPGRATESRLVAEYPRLRDAVPWIPLATCPTPVEPCTNISSYLGRSDVWMKRDDAIHPVFGGNKIRRFEHLLADAKNRGAQEIITVGGLASTQVTATILLGKTLGFGVTSVLFDQPLTSFARQSLLIQASTGGRMLYGGSYARTAIVTIRKLWQSRRSAYFVAPGASGPLANLGYVSAAFELADQVARGDMPRPDVIVVPAGSGGTAAALCLGATLLGWNTTIVAVRITDRIVCNRATLGLLVESTKAYLSKRIGGLPRRTSSKARIEMDHACAGRGYGHPTNEAIAACPEVKRLIGAPGEITYSGKTLVGLRRACASYPGKTILLWNTLSSVWPTPTVRLDELDPQFQRFFEGELAI